MGSSATMTMASMARSTSEAISPDTPRLGDGPGKWAAGSRPSPSVPIQVTCSSAKFPGWASSIHPRLYSSSTARNRTMTSSRSTRPAVSRVKVMVPTRGSSSSSSATASATLARMGATWSRSTRGVGGAPGRPGMPARSRSGVTPARRSGVISRKRSSSPAVRGKERPAASMIRFSAAAASLNVLHSNSRARSRSRSSQRASSSSSSTSSLPGSSRRAFSSSSTAAMSRNSVATSRSSGGQVLDLGHVGVDDRRQRHLVDVHLLAGDEVQQQVEGPLEHSRGDLVGHRGPENTGGAGDRTGDTIGPVTRVLSGIQPTGDIHLGNYLGALRWWVADQYRLRRATSASSTCTP